MSRRGHVAVLVLVASVAAMTLVGVFVTRLGVELEARRGNAVRTQALALAHGACATGKTGSVKTAAGLAQVTRKGQSVSVRLGAFETSLECR